MQVSSFAGTLLGVSIRRGVEIIGFAQDDTGVDVHLAGAEPVRAAYLVGAAGGQGIGLGVQEAVNPGWKLAQVVRGDSHERCWTPTTTSGTR